jgi:hypothetical protein
VRHQRAVEVLDAARRDVFGIDPVEVGGREGEQARSRTVLDAPLDQCRDFGQACRLVRFR